MAPPAPLRADRAVIGAGAAAEAADARSAARTSIEVETPTAVVSGRGNQFIVVYDTEKRTTDVFAVERSLAVIGKLAVLGRPVLLGPGTRTTVRSGAFPALPAKVAPDKLAELQRRLDFTVKPEDSLLTEITGANSRAVKEVLEVPVTQLPGASATPADLQPRLPRARPRDMSRGAEIIDDSIRE